MPRRVVFRNPLTGRFVSPEEAGDLEQVVRAVYGGDTPESQILEFGRIAEDLTQDAEPNWTQDDTSRWGSRWAAEDGLNLSALGGQQFPEGFDAFRITYTVPPYGNNVSGFANTEWVGPEHWPPSLDMLERGNPTGIAQIVFRNA